MKYLALVILWCVLTSFSSLCPAAANDPNFQYRDFNNTSGNGTPSAPSAPAAPAPAPLSGSYDPKDISPPPVAPPPSSLRVETEIRSPYGIGSNVTIYGGVNAFQNGTLKITSPAAPGAEVRGSTHDVLGGVGGIKMGFTWESFSAIGANRDSANPVEPDLVEPSIGLDFFWSGYRYKAEGSGTTTSGRVTASYDGSLRADVNTYALCVEPTFKFNLGAFRPYVGFGVGGTYIDASHAHIEGTASALGLGAAGGLDLTGSSQDLDFTAEALAGAEYFFDAHWALSFDYKYVYLLSPTFHGDVPGSTVRYHLSGLGESMFTTGISYYF